MMQHSKLNIPLRMIGGAMSNKKRLQLIAMSIAIKCNYADSRMRNVSVKAIQELLHCGFNTAKTLFTEAQKCSLFRYNPVTRTLLAKNFKKKFINKITTKRGNEAYMVYCFKLDVKDYTLRSLVKELKVSIIKSCINTQERKNKFPYNGNLSNTNLFVSTHVLTQSRLAKKIGVKSRTTVQRLVKELENNKVIRVERPKIEYVNNCTSDEALKETFLNPKVRYIYNERTGVLFTIYPCRYNFTSRVENERFQNIILNHESRIKPNYNYSSLEAFNARYGY